MRGRITGSDVATAAAIVATLALAVVWTRTGADEPPPLPSPVTIALPREPAPRVPERTVAPRSV
ncbi:MAG: hypothetical protein WBC33_01405, partial [Conexibacter sp.]